MNDLFLTFLILALFPGVFNKGTKFIPNTLKKLSKKKKRYCKKTFCLWKKKSA